MMVGTNHVILFTYFTLRLRMRGLKTLPAPHRSTHCGHVLRCVMRCVFLQPAFLPLGQLHLPDASFDGRADVGHLVTLIHSFHFQSVVLP